jgi:hypothetical protein
MLLQVAVLVGHCVRIVDPAPRTVALEPAHVDIHLNVLRVRSSDRGSLK